MKSMTTKDFITFNALKVISIQFKINVIIQKIANIQIVYRVISTLALNVRLDMF